MKLSQEQIKTYADSKPQPENEIDIRTTAADARIMARELVAARRLIASFESMLTGCNVQTFAGYENGNGTNVGDKIEAARRAYSKV